MKKKSYGFGIKALVLGLHVLISMMVVISAFLLIFLFRNHILSLDTIENKKYERSSGFLTQFESAMDDMQKLENWKKMFETEGVYDSEKRIVVEDFKLQRNETTASLGAEPPSYERAEKKKTEYRLQDLLDWANEGYQQIPYVSEVCLEHPDQSYLQRGTVWIDAKRAFTFSRKIRTLRELDIEIYNKGILKLVNQADNFESYMQDDASVDMFLKELGWQEFKVSSHAQLIEEDYKPIDGDTLRSRIEDRRMSLAQAEAVSNQLTQILDEIRDDVDSYRRLSDQYENKQGNFIYWMYDRENKTIVTNAKDISNFSVEAYGKKMGAYLYWNPQEARLRSNISGIEEYIYGENRKIEDFGMHTELMFAVDTDYPQQDLFQKGAQQYNTFRPWLQPCAFLILFGSMGWMVCILALTSMAGRIPGEEEIHLCWLDRIKTELLIVGLSMFIAIMFYFYLRLATGELWEVPGTFVMAGTLTFMGYCGFIIGYLSLVRRIKARRLWEDSVVCWLIHVAGRLLKKGPFAVRILLTFFGNTCALTFLSVRAFTGQSIWWKIALVAFWCWGASFYIRTALQRREIQEGVEKISSGDLEYKISTNKFYRSNKKMADGVNRIGDGLQNAVDASTKNERMKAALITNVSHDIKTPLTSIINYANLIQMQKIEDEKINGYIDILIEKSQRLKQLTEDLVEASKISSGNITLDMVKLDFVELIYQTAGEFNEKFEEKDLTAVTRLPRESVMIYADGRRIWRVVENLYNNVAKYAMEHTRVYVELMVREEEAYFTIRNISKQEIKVSGEELTARFTRGDESRTTEGSGLGLSIAQNLTILMNGRFEITVDGDIFKAQIVFPLAKKEADGQAAEGGQD